MTLNKAREILGKSSKNITDEQLQREMETAEFLANLFLDQYLKHKKELQPSRYPSVMRTSTPSTLAK